MGKILCRNVKEKIEEVSRPEKEIGTGQYKEINEEIYRVTGEKPDFSSMTEKQYQEWLDKGYEALKDEAVKKNEVIHLQATNPATGEVTRWSFEPAGKNPAHDAVKDGDHKGNTLDGEKVTIWSKVKEKLPTAKEVAGLAKDAAVKTADVAAREAQSLAKGSVNKLEHITDVGAGGFGR